MVTERVTSNFEQQYKSLWMEALTELWLLEISVTNHSQCVKRNKEKKFCVHVVIFSGLALKSNV